MRVFIVGCSREKQSTSAPARLLYQSPRFVAASRLAEQFGDRWFVLSGRHGLVLPDEVLEPYDFDLRQQDAFYKMEWANKAFAGLTSQIAPGAQITFLSAPEYSVPLATRLLDLGYSVFEPLRFRQRHLQLLWMDEIFTPSVWSKDVATLYALVQRVAAAVGESQSLSAQRGGSTWPDRGLYFFRDSGESRWARTEVPRVVRVGTHAVSRGSRASLWNRLRTHRGSAGSSGNHRSSIFRLHVGAAMRARYPELAVPESWGKGQSASSEVRLLEQEHETRVSQYIGKLGVLWLEIPDEPSPDSDRAYLEQNSIALLAGNRGPLDPATSDWLGNWSPHPCVRSSGMWNVDYVERRYDERFLGVLETYVEAFELHRPMPASSIAPRGWRMGTSEQPNKSQLRLFTSESG